MIFSHRRAEASGAYRQAGASRWRMQRSAEASWDLQAGRGKQMANATLGRGKLGLTGRQRQAEAYN